MLQQIARVDPQALSALGLVLVRAKPPAPHLDVLIFKDLTGPDQLAATERHTDSSRCAQSCQANEITAFLSS
jgi:hypothetical protein